jgi:hypothetical protein
METDRDQVVRSLQKLDWFNQSSLRVRSEFLRLPILNNRMLKAFEFAKCIFSMNRKRISRADRALTKHSRSRHVGDYQLRHRTPGADVDVCFGGRIAVTAVRLL